MPSSRSWDGVQSSICVRPLVWVGHSFHQAASVTSPRAGSIQVRCRISVRVCSRKAIASSYVGFVLLRSLPVASV
jgi:hypothetical protein